MMKNMQKESTVVREFSRFANEYRHHSMIQSEVAREIVSYLPRRKIDSIIDIGSGDGKIYQYLGDSNVDFDRFVALDASCEMLELHPSSVNIQKICVDFNSIQDLQRVKKTDILISSSALQWSDDLDATIKQLSSMANYFYLTMFTSNTFSQIHDFVHIESPIYEKSFLEETLSKYLDVEIYTKEYKIEFKNRKEMFAYIKKSGISGGEKRLSHKESKRLLRDYPHNFLEFEVLFAVSK